VRTAGAQGAGQASPIQQRGPGPRAADVDDVIALMRLNYDRVVARYGRAQDATA
jgi:hypothetical protein